MAKNRKNTAKKKAVIKKNSDSIKIKLSIGDRISLLGILPKEGDIITLVLAKDIRLKTELSQNELKKCGIKRNEKGGGLTWKIQKIDKTIIFTNAEITLLKSQIEKLDKSKKITSELLDLCVMIRDIKPTE